MRAAVLHGREDLRVEEVAPRRLNDGEVRVKIRAALTCGTDLKVYRRGYHAKMIVPPAVFGHELAGEVLEIHPATTGWRSGERVVVANSAPCGECAFCAGGQENLCDDLLFLNGAYAESIIVPARLVSKNMLRLRDETAFVDAALTEPLACVVQGLNDLALRGGEELLVIGAGPIGLMFAVLAQHRGCRVTVAGRGEERMRAAAALGARALDLSDAEDMIHSDLRGRFDAVVEAVGKPKLWETALHMVRKGGTVNFFGGCPSGTFVRFDTGLIHYSNLRMVASFHHTPRTVRQALDYIEAGVIRARDFVTGSCSLAELPGLFESMVKGNRSIKTLVNVAWIAPANVRFGILP
jgi:L-iditol 2-dehydrogenase